jgi:hypothetical protein
MRCDPTLRPTMLHARSLGPTALLQRHGDAIWSNHWLPTGLLMSQAVANAARVLFHCRHRPHRFQSTDRAVYNILTLPSRHLPLNPYTPTLASPPISEPNSSRWRTPQSPRSPLLHRRLRAAIALAQLAASPSALTQSLQGTNSPTPPPSRHPRGPRTAASAPARQT